MIESHKHVRGLVALGLAIGLVAAACSSSTSPLGNVPGGGGNNGAGGTGSLTSGLASNLNTLTSYKFSWQLTTSSSGASAADTGSFGINGTVVNKPVKSYLINDLGMLQILVVGTQGWTSLDNGNSWMVSTDYADGTSSLDSLLPTDMYGSDFDTNAGQFKAVGSGNKNGVDCIHYQGNQNLGVGGALLGVSGNFTSDLWVAKSGNYPVSGFYGYTASAGGQSGTWGYSFDVTDINGADNVISPPTNVTELPTF
jgi:hypothetical protein